ncbi:MAG: DUF3784 domain-containing protein [Candidatus Pacearchaeota archaeon]|nr:DUF3784 domain-containing protein [Candidatus Pacearchaeota archaeon]
MGINIIGMINLLTAIVILLLALIIKIFNLSNLIAGYNTLSVKEKKKYNEKKLVSYISNMLIIASCILFLGSLPALFNLYFQIYFFTASWVVFTLFIFVAIIFINYSKNVKR